MKCGRLVALDDGLAVGAGQGAATEQTELWRPVQRTEEGRGGLVAGVVVLIFAVVVGTGWLFWPRQAERMKGEHGAASPAVSQPAKKDGVRPREGIWRSEKGADREITVSLQVTHHGKYLRSVNVSGQGNRNGEFDAYGVLFYGVLEIEGGKFEESGKGCTITGEFTSPTEVSGHVTLQEKPTSARFAGPWSATWTSPLKRRY